MSSPDASNSATWSSICVDSYLCESLADLHTHLCDFGVSRRRCIIKWSVSVIVSCRSLGASAKQDLHRQKSLARLGASASHRCDIGLSSRCCQGKRSPSSTVSRVDLCTSVEQSLWGRSSQEFLVPHNALSLVPRCRTALTMQWRLSSFADRLQVRSSADKSL